jgi:hypothetical protein
MVPYAGVLAGLYWLQSAWAALLLYHCGMAAFLLAERRKPLFGALKINAPGFFWPALASCLLSGPVLFLLWPQAKLPGAGMADILVRFGLGGWPFLLFAVYYSTAHPVLEEIFWRQDAGHEAPRYAEDLAFAGYHLLVLWLFLKPAFLVPAFVFLAAAGMAWRRMAAEHGDRLAAVITHAAGDVSTIAAAALLANG